MCLSKRMRVISCRFEGDGWCLRAAQDVAHGDLARLRICGVATGDGIGVFYSLAGWRDGDGRACLSFEGVGEQIVVAVAARTHEDQHAAKYEQGENECDEQEQQQVAVVVRWSAAFARKCIVRRQSRTIAYT